MKILSLRAENVKRLTAVHIAPDGAPVVVISGENEAGKSSVLDSIAMALGGKNLVPAKPIRDGESRAEICVDLGEYIVTRVFTPTGGSLTVTNRDGAKFPSPQALLDGLVGRLTFDPLAFAEQAEKDPKSAADTLRRLAGIDTTDLETERKKVFDERTLINRDVTQLTGALAKAVKHPDVAAEPRSAADLSKQLDAADELAATAAEALTASGRAEHAWITAKQLAAAKADAVDRARQALEDAETASLEADEAVHETKRVFDDSVTQRKVADAAVPDRKALREQLAAIEQFNAKVRDNQAAAQLTAQLAGKRKDSEALTTRLNVLDNEKVERLTSAAFPVEGLGLDDVVGVTWNGLPFTQASSAVRVRASVAIGLALNPKLRVLLVRNGNDLGQKNLKLIAEMAEASGGQLWIERIAGGDGLPTILIEDGAVVAPRVRSEEVPA